MKTLIGKFPELLQAKNASDAQKTLVSDGYRRLRESIRNRDAHGYHRGVRQKDFPFGGILFSHSIQHVTRLVGRVLD